MENPDGANKLGQNWKIVALVAAVLLAGAVMGHSLLTGGWADNPVTAAKPACQTCPASQVLANQENVAASVAPEGQAEGSCCAKKTGCCEAQTSNEAGCCAQKTTGCCSTGETEQPKTGCACCPSSTDAQ